MTNNDILRRIRYIFDLGDDQVMKIFSLGGQAVTREQACNWLKQDSDPDFQKCNDRLLATFLNGFITSRRGKKEGPQPQPEKRLTNNQILMKLKIALELRAEDILGILALADFRLSKHELSALFRRPDHKHYRECRDQILRNFLKGLQLRYRKNG